MSAATTAAMMAAAGASDGAPASVNDSLHWTERTFASCVENSSYTVEQAMNKSVEAVCTASQSEGSVAFSIFVGFIMAAVIMAFIYLIFG